MSVDQAVISYNAYDEKPVRIDYSVLSVGVMTLGLVLMVEVGRHKLDQMTQHSAFYSAVLKRVYSELATLGIVEFLLHLMAEYYDAYDKAKKQVFADVHFLLFYTAILNAVQSALLYVVVKRISKKLWIDTERLDVGHYVELREEFDAVRNQLEKLRKRRRRRHGRGTTEDISHDAENPDHGFRVDESSEYYFEFTAAGIAGAVQNLVDTIRFPVIKAKYNDLLLQVRFHELRVHFLQAYNLPLKFQVSDYLIRSEHHVLVKLIKVSPIAWLLLTGLANLVYYVLGIVSYKIQSAKIVGITMIYLFFIALFLFVVLSWILHNKMKRIFKQIMNTGTLWDVDDSSKRTDLSAVQKSLFWAADPKLVIAAIQFMQFGYALAVATVIIFWEELNDGPTPMFWYILVVCVCYLVCIGVTAQIIPRYTLCTNLAQLVDEQRLHEALASFRLNEARHRELEKTQSQYHTFLESDSVVSTQPSMETTKKPGSFDGGHTLFDNHSTAVLIRNMVKSDIASLRDNLPDSVKESMGSTKRTKNRVKQFSDGVSSMARCRIIQQDTGVPIPSHNECFEHLPSRRRRSRSEGVSFMAKAQHLSLDGVQGTNRFNYEFDPSNSGHSDIHDVLRTTNVQHAIQSSSVSQGKFSVSLQIKLYAYFMSRRFIVISNIFGTMRIESFFLSENIGNSTVFVHFDFAHDFVFWLLFTWLVLFIIQSLLVFYSIGYRPLVSLKEKTVVVASVLDLLLTVLCMVVLLYAESKRCCNPESDEFVIELNRKTAPCSCPAFGSRQYGGLGTIEPWLSIIALRIFRHWFAKRIVLMTEKGEGKLKNEHLLTQQSQLLNPFDVFTQSTNGCHKEIKSGQNHTIMTTHHDGHVADPRGTAAELWEAAIGQHPDIVAKHGEFSVEVLRTMLGLEPYAETIRAEESDRRTRNSPEKTFTVKENFAHLSKDAQRFIASGVLGGDVVEVPTNTPNGRPHFQLCRLTRQASELSMFIAPDANLIRSMRRCDKKFLPLLQKWIVVDVVLTCFEMVYFAADIIDNCELSVHAEAAREALAATEGGKGCLRLCDVAQGRRVIGSIGLTDLVSVHVQRSTGRGEYMRPVEKPNAEVQNVEYWKKDHFETSADREGKTRSERWVTVQQDELRLVTSHGETAYFRFYSDLEDASNNPGLYANDDYEKGKIAKNNALHWAQTIGRICGKGQLKQSLAHFGQGDPKEICDYLIFYSHDKKPSFRFSSLRDLADQVEI